jgi:hypothetical protein
MAAAKPEKKAPRKRAANPYDVTAEDLEDLDDIHGLLRVLNDPMAAGRDVGQYIEQIPRLKERILRSARLRSGHIDMKDLGPALVILGNKGLESELLQLLEDMTIAKAEMADS